LNEHPRGIQLREPLEISDDGVNGAENVGDKVKTNQPEENTNLDLLGTAQEHALDHHNWEKHDCV
jgi:hypothetical protein